MNNEFLELVSSPLMNLDHTYRYSGTKLAEAESLSQHIVDTIMLGLKIIDKVNDIAKEELVSPSAYLMKAVFHDLEEVITGDIPRPLKYYNDDTRDSLKGVAAQVARSFFDEQFSPEYSDDCYDIWNRAKEGPAGYILKIVDTLVVANKVVKEVTLLNNFYMLRVAHEVRSYLNELRYQSKPFESTRVILYIAGLLDDAISCMDNIIEKYADIIESLNITRMSMI